MVIVVCVCDHHHHHGTDRSIDRSSSATGGVLGVCVWVGEAVVSDTAALQQGVCPAGHHLRWEVGRMLRAPADA